MIEVDHLTKYYGPNAAVRDVNFTVERGEILGFLGPNGAGKSTTMRIITGYLPASEGTVRVDGYDVASDSLEVRRRIGYLPELVPLYTDMSVFDYLNFMGKLKEMNNTAQRKQRIGEVMEQVHIDDVANKLIGRLSRGYKQRVGLAQALLHNPEVLILDEPTVGLDPRQIIEIRELIKSLGQDHTIILSTHILPEVSMLCSRVVIINRGRLVAVDTPLNLAEDVNEASRLQVTVRGPRDGIQRALNALPGVTGIQDIAAASADGSGNMSTFEVVSAPRSDLRSAVARAVVTNNWDLLELRPVVLDLEEIFLRVTSREPEEEYTDEGEYMDGEEPLAMADSDDYGDEELPVMAEEFHDEEELVEEPPVTKQADNIKIKPRSKGARR